MRNHRIRRAQAGRADSLIEGLKRLEYRGYDSAGLAIVGPDQGLTTRKRPGKISELEAALNGTMPPG